MVRALPDLTVRKRIVLHNLISGLSTNSGVALGKDAAMRDAVFSLTSAVAVRGKNATLAQCKRRVRRRYGRMILQTLSDEAL